MLNKYRAILFDMDGTIADTDQMLVEVFDILCDKYRQGIKTPYEKLIYFSGPPIADTLKDEFPSANQKEIFDDFVRLSWEYYPKTIKTYPNCREVLLRLKSQGIALAVVTNKQKASAIKCLELIHLEDIFDVVVGRDDVDNGKPAPDGLLKACELLKVNPTNSIYVGDNEIDYISAENGHIDSALVNWGPRNLNPNLHPTYWVSSFLDLEAKLS